METKDFINIVLSIPKTIYFNFRYLPFKQAIKLPIWLTYNTFVKISGGNFERRSEILNDSYRLS